MRMNERIIIDGKEYCFVEAIPAVPGGEAVILCTDKAGAKYACPEEVWRRNAPPVAIEELAPVRTNSSTQEKIDCFLSMFRGRDDLYAKRYYSTNTGKSGYTPVCKNEWVKGVCDKKAHKCPECPNRAFQSLTTETIRSHLLGRDLYCRDVVAIYPMLEDDTTWLLAADFDEACWRADVSAFRKTCMEYGLTPAVERSRSGNGAHIWFFFCEPVSAADARKLGSGLLTQTMACRHELSFASYDRLFPSQDTLPKGGFGNLIALPFQGQAQKDGNTLFVDEQFEPYPDQWAFLSTLPKITSEQVAECLSGLCVDGDMGQLADTSEQKPWPRRRERKRLAQTDFPVQARLMISNLIYIDKQGFSQSALNAVKRLAAFRNPEFYKKQAMRLRIYDTPRVFDCSYEDGQFLGIPRGCISPLTELLNTYHVPVSLDDCRTTGRALDVSFSGVLRPEQMPAAQALLSDQIGVLSATTAFGKTVVGAYLIGQRKVSTLILVHSSALLEQWKNSLSQFLDIRETLPEQPKKRGRKKKQYLIGQIGAGKNTRSGIVDIAIMQSLFEGPDKEVRSFVAEYGMVIVDECHHVAAFTFERILKTVEAKYVYGLSATPVRQDGHQSIIFMQCGPVRYLVDAKSQAEKRVFSHYVFPRFTRTRLPDAKRIQDVYASIVDNDTRNGLIVADALNLLTEGRTPILLTERKEHALQLANLLEGKAQHLFLLVGSDSQKKKREKLAALRMVPSQESLVVVATGKYIGEGFDEPRLDTMLLAMPISWKGTLAQYAGRLHRNYDGKQEVRIYDYVDVHIPMLERMYHKRLRGYAELGYQVKLGEQETGTSKLYNGQNYLTDFMEDISGAVRSILIVSPYLQKSRISGLLPALKCSLSSGTRITIYTRPAESYKPDQQTGISAAISMLEDAEITIITRNDIQQCYAIVDQSIVWYGSMDFLAFGGKDADALRFENAEIAGELLDVLSELSDQ